MSLEKWPHLCSSNFATDFSNTPVMHSKGNKKWWWNDTNSLHWLISL